YPELDDPRAFAGGAPAPGADPSDLRAYHQRHITEAEAQFDERETTLSHLFRRPHAALGGQTYGAALAQGLLARGAKEGGTLVETGGGLGFVGAELKQALQARSVHLDLSPVLQRAQRSRGLTATRADARALPVKRGAADIFIANEMAGDLGTGPEAEGSERMVNHGP